MVCHPVAAIRQCFRLECIQQRNLDGPAAGWLRSTMRMEMSRAGGEDCEMFVLLEKSRDALRKTGHAAAAAEAEALLAEVGQLSSSWGNLFSPIQNGEKMEVLRNRIGDFLDRHFSERGK